MKAARLLAAIGAASLVATATGAQAPTGDLRLSYRFEAADQTSPYRLYVPRTYDGRRALPLLVVLHGGGRDENADLDRSRLREIAEQRGVIVVVPLGYNRFGSFGNIYPIIGTRRMAETAESLRAQSGGASPPPPARRPAEPEPAAQTDDAGEIAASALVDARTARLSAEDVFNVVAIVRGAYRIDPRRIYMMGNSMGGAGTLAIAARRPEMFAALSPSGGPVAAWSYPFARLRNARVPVLFVHGDHDGHSNASWSRAMLNEARSQGVQAGLLVVPGGDHPDGWTMVLSRTFDFFLAHRRTQPAPDR